MKKIEKLLLTLSVVFASVFGVTQSAFAMHIMEGYLPKAHCIAWGVICIPFLVAGFISLKKIVTKERKSLIVLAMAGAYTFVLSALKILVYLVLLLTLQVLVLVLHFLDQV